MSIRGISAPGLGTYPARRSGGRSVPALPGQRAQAGGHPRTPTWAGPAEAERRSEAAKRKMEILEASKGVLSLGYRDPPKRFHQPFYLTSTSTLAAQGGINQQVHSFRKPGKGLATSPRPRWRHCQKLCQTEVDTKAVWVFWYAFPQLKSEAQICFYEDEEKGEGHSMLISFGRVGYAQLQLSFCFLDALDAEVIHLQDLLV